MSKSKKSVNNLNNSKSQSYNRVNLSNSVNLTNKSNLSNLADGDDSDDELQRVSVMEGLKSIADISSNNPDYIVMSDDEVLENMQADLEKRILRASDEAKKAELKKELLILKILILQREKIDKEAAILLNDADTFGKDLSEHEASKKKKREKEKEKKQQELNNLIFKLNELSIPGNGTNKVAGKAVGKQEQPKKVNSENTVNQNINVNSTIISNSKNEATSESHREKGGNSREERIR